MKTILVSGASGIVGYGILKSLRSSTGDYRLIGTTIYEDSVAPAFCDIFERAPATNDSQYLDWLCRIIAKHAVDLILPGIEADMHCWNRSRALIEQAGAQALLNTAELIELCRDKWVFYQKLLALAPEYAIPSSLEPDFAALQSGFGLPFLLKPRCGYGARGIVQIESAEQFQPYAEKVGKELMAQPIIGDAEQEYTAAAFFDRDSNYLCGMTLQRKLAKEGYTEKARVVEMEDIVAATTALGRVFRPVGPTNFQFRRNRLGGLSLLEINPRISSATSIRTAFGYNEAEISARYFLEGVLPAVPVIRRGVAIRYAEDAIFYDRDHL